MDGTPSETGGRFGIGCEGGGPAGGAFAAEDLLLELKDELDVLARLDRPIDGPASLCAFIFACQSLVWYADSGRVS